MEKYYIQIYRILLFNPMLKLKNIIKYSPYSLEKSQKNKLFKDFFTELTFAISGSPSIPKLVVKKTVSPLIIPDFFKASIISDCVYFIFQ